MDALISLCLDQSGSMSSCYSGTVEGVNSFLKEQREVEGTTLLSLTLFDTNFDVRYVGVDLTEVPDLGSEENPYGPQGMTALYDAVVTTIKGTAAWLDKHPDFDGKIMVVIQTDGGENSSQTATINQVNDLITAKRGEGWEFLFMGAGEAAWTEGRNFTSIPMAAVASYGNDNESSLRSYAGLSANVTNTRTTGVALAAAGMSDPDKEQS